VVLRYALMAPKEEWAELRDLCIPPPVKQIARDLDTANNVYRHIAHALVAFLAREASKESGHV
jgi:nitrate reductase assembly molybdenum cofactor insertion protein NarJ